eukprot:CAMPEP_0171282774 /NCGR_PEP_ID=MMETSP0790-20130122/67090_1 /TAXON_ID=2925 /ORGANISM="Alexandrium catenella, Strain OF101" /LENGTH=43 /DNA_ID= /DNA_START= /DNA_END= /DNA_ORIENTATION=
MATGEEGAGAVAEPTLNPAEAEAAGALQAAELEAFHQSGVSVV